MAALRQLVVKRLRSGITFNKPQANAVFQRIEDWFETGRDSCYKVIDDTAPGVLTDEQKEQFLIAYMRVRALGIPEKRVAPDYYDDWKDILHDLESQTDRGAAIVGAALLDSRLETALRHCFVPDLSEKLYEELFDGPTAPLSSFSAKTRLSHALGMLGSLSFADLNRIRTIRNKFAHNLQLRSFSEPPVAELCEKLKLADFTFNRLEPPSEPRRRFISAVVNAAHFVYSEIVAGTRVGENPEKSP